MENDNYIDPSLQIKIYENDLKFKSLLNKGLLSSSFEIVVFSSSLGISITVISGFKV